MVTKSAKAELLFRFDRVAEALADLDSDTLEGYDSAVLLPKLIEFHQAAEPFVNSMRRKPQTKKVKRFGLSELQVNVLERAQETGRIAIYEGYRRFIRTADSLVRRELMKPDRHAITLSNTSCYDLTDAGRKMLEKLANRH